jgi:hypothetical protein
MLGLMSAVTGSKQSYLRPGSKGLVLHHEDGSEFRISGGKATILKRGPLVCAIRFEGGGRGLSNTVDMIFPRSKSWVEIRWIVEDPERVVTALIADLNLLLEGSTTLVDFGANDTVYDALKPGQRLAFQAAPAEPKQPRWFVNLNDEPYASGSAVPEGWAHVMDSQRAMAIAVEGFGRESRDRIEAAADGHLVIRRRLLSSRERTMHFWLHFVTMPVQVGAATSPQSMQNPLVVEKQ